MRPETRSVIKVPKPEPSSAFGIRLAYILTRIWLLLLLVTVSADAPFTVPVPSPYMGNGNDLPDPSFDHRELCAGVRLGFRFSGLGCTRCLRLSGDIRLTFPSVISPAESCSTSCLDATVRTFPISWTGARPSTADTDERLSRGQRPRCETRCTPFCFQPSNRCAVGKKKGWSHSLRKDISLPVVV